MILLYFRKKWLYTKIILTLKKKDFILLLVRVLIQLKIVNINISNMATVHETDFYFYAKWDEVKYQ